MVEWMIERKAVHLPDGRLSMGSSVVEAARHYGRVFAEHVVENTNRDLVRQDRHSHQVGHSFFKVLDPVSGLFKLRSLQDSSERLFREHGFVGGFSVLPAARIRLHELLKREYPSFIRKNGITNSPESYGLFMLGVLQHFSREVSGLYNDLRLNPTHRSAILSELRFHIPRPFNKQVAISDWAQSGASEPTMPHQDTSPYHFLNKLNQGAGKMALLKVWPQLLDDPVQRRQMSTKMALEFSKMSEQFGFDSK